MSRKNQTSRIFLAFIGTCLLAGAGGSTGCDQITARQKIQDGTSLYKKGDYVKAAEKFDEALAIDPDLVIGQHNAALANFRAWSPGMESDANKQYAKKAGEHFEKYLESEPEDVEVINLLTTLWVDSQQHDRALEYWGERLEKDPKNDEILKTLAGINNKVGRHDEAVKWLRKRIDLATTDAARAGVLLHLADVQRSRLTKTDVVDEERVAIADVGIEALLDAQKIDPKNPRIESYLGTIYQLRALGHGAAWARAADSASQRYHQIRFVKLRDHAAPTPEKPEPGKAGDSPKASK